MLFASVRCPIGDGTFLRPCWLILSHASPSLANQNGLNFYNPKSHNPTTKDYLAVFIGRSKQKMSPLEKNFAVAEHDSHTSTTNRRRAARGNADVVFQNGLTAKRISSFHCL